MELGLARGDKQIVCRVSEECRERLPGHPLRIDNEMKTVFQACAKLTFFKVQYSLSQFLNGCVLNPTIKTQKIPNTWEVNDPRLIYSALQGLELHSYEVSIHRAYGQMRLHAVVDDVAVRRKNTRPLDVLKELVESEGGQPREMTMRLNKCKAEYYKGRKWLEIADWFGGMGAIILFVVAGM